MMLRAPHLTDFVSWALICTMDKYHSSTPLGLFKTIVKRDPKKILQINTQLSFLLVSHHSDVRRKLCSPQQL
jgi:hypothetical protein